MDDVSDLQVVSQLYETMALIRAFEVAASRLMARGALDGFLHISIGQEAVAAGVCSALDRADYITSTHRGHGHCIAKGGDVTAMMAEILGRASGYCAGRSGSMHVADPSLGILGANAIVGAGIPIAVGAAYSAQLQGEHRVAVAFFGDGAVAQGVFHESLNIAALWKLPVVFVCEANLYAEMTPTDVHLSNPAIAQHADRYGIPGSVVDGNNVLEVRRVASTAIERARGGHGPTLIEARTYRIHGHFEGDPQRYRTRDEVDRWKERDPLVRLRAMAAAGHGDLSAQFDAIDQVVGARVDEAVQKAEGDPPPTKDSLTQDVYSDASGFADLTA